MKCEKCGKNAATTHIRTVVNGIVIEKNLCDICAADEGYGLSANTGLAGMLASMFGSALGENSTKETECPICKSTFSQIAESGKVGCARCYEAFKGELLPYIKRVQGSTKHIGKAPEAQKAEELTAEGLRRELSRLISEENYEQAAVIRDKIKELEGKENG